MFYHAKFSAEEEVGEVVKSNMFDMRSMSDRVKSVMLHDQDIIDKRWDICNSCEHFNKTTTQCGKCGCFMKLKHRIATVACPVDKWQKEYNFIEGKPTNGTLPVVK